VNSLIDPSDAVTREIDGMRAENPGRYPTRESFLFQEVERIPRWNEMITEREDLPRNYGRSVQLNFEYAFDRVQPAGSERVLEVGAEHDFPFLQRFRELGCECYATNLYLSYERDQPPGAQVVLGDMNRLPYRSGMFDIVLLSATSHHSPDLAGLLMELSRVTKPSGWVLLLNDPTHGVFKHALDRFGLGVKKGGDRCQLVNENEYSAAAYRRLAKAAGFNVHESFFSVFYDHKLCRGQMDGVRFAPLARIVSRAWQIRPIRRFLLKTALYPGQLLIGLELNLILKKREDVIE